jgi:hypothetical protein
VCCGAWQENVERRDGTSYVVLVAVDRLTRTGFLVAPGRECVPRWSANGRGGYRIQRLSILRGLFERRIVGRAPALRRSISFSGLADVCGLAQGLVIAAGGVAVDRSYASSGRALDQGVGMSPRSFSCRGARPDTASAYSEPRRRPGLASGRPPDLPRRLLRTRQGASDGRRAWSEDVDVLARVADRSASHDRAPPGRTSV